MSVRRLVKTNEPFEKLKWLEESEQAPDADLKLLFAKNLISSELCGTISSELRVFGKDTNDYRTDGGTGRIRDIIDPDFNALPTQWVPAQFEILRDKVVKITSDINNVPRIGTWDLYSQIELIFAKMLPMCETLYGSELGQEIQVIVKAQDYELKNGEHWSGSLHREGTSRENILLVGICYYEIDSQLTGGKLEFGTLVHGWCGNLAYASQELSVEEGDCVVFKNDANYHKMNTLTFAESKTEASEESNQSTAKRKILAFFVVHPETPKPSTRNTRPYLREYVNNFFDLLQITEISISDDIQNLIIDFVGIPEPTAKHIIDTFHLQSCRQCSCEKFTPSKWKRIVCSICRHSDMAHSIDGQGVIQDPKIAARNILRRSRTTTDRKSVVPFQRKD